MTALLLLQMSYSLAGELLHEITGITLFVLFILHHILSFNFTKALFKGKRAADKIIKAVIDILLTLNVLLLMFSAVAVSKHVFTFIPAYSLAALGRVIHMLAGYWSFALISLHIGFHLDIMLQKPMKDKKKAIIAKSIMAVIFIIGAVFFITEGIYKYMFMVNMFVFVDYDSGLAVFLIKYVFIMGMFTILGYCLMQAIKQKNKGR